ncbi:MAG: NAD(P)-dependent malic enzyme [Dehalobacterium sp.]
MICDRNGAIYRGRKTGMNPYKEEIAERTNPNLVMSLTDALKGADVFIGVSTSNVVSEEMVRSMNNDPIILAMANPIPEIMPEEAKMAGARIVGTGRMDYPNQVNNLLCFPGILRGALDSRATVINDEMKIAAVYAIASMVKPEDLNEDCILPNALDKNIAKEVAKAVYNAAHDSGVARS